MERKNQLIEVISKAGDQYGNLLIKFMEKNSLSNLSCATSEQLERFIKEENIKS